MYIVIVGGGKVGLNLTKLLEKQNHDIAVIELKPEHCKKIVDETNALAILGDGSDIRYLEDANCGTADVLVAVTGRDEDNLVACQLAKAAFSVPKVIARVNNPSNSELFKALSVDVTFDSTQILSKLIHEGLGLQDLITLAPIAKGKLRIVETRICNPALVGKKLIELGLGEKGILVVSIIRGEEVIIPYGATQLEKDDQIIVVITEEAEEDFKRIITC
jgi:trk/ktr system potassium uptake protein